jgi:FAD/FMN-containing dehydrogenase
VSIANAITYGTAQTLRAAIAGEVFFPGDPGYDQGRRAWNLAVEERPAVVVVARSDIDVARAVRFARAQGLRIAPQGTGHGAQPLEPLEIPVGASALLPPASYRRLQKIKASYDPGQVVISTRPVWPARGRA